MKKVRVYIDHTGRWYKDYTEEELAASRADPLMMILETEVRAALDQEIIQLINER